MCRRELASCRRVCDFCPALGPVPSVAEAAESPASRPVSACGCACVSEQGKALHPLTDFSGARSSRVLPLFPQEFCTGNFVRARASDGLAADADGVPEYSSRAPETMRTALDAAVERAVAR
jgi:hypothetical protein